MSRAMSQGAESASVHCDTSKKVEPMNKRQPEAGQALVVVAIGMVVILGFLGLGLDLGYLRHVKREAQRTADAAAIAAALEITSCNWSSSCSAMTTAASKALAENGYSGTPTLQTQAGGSCGNTLSSDKLVVVVNTPPCFMGSKAADPHYGDKHYVEVVVSQVAPLMFARVFGGSNSTIIARSESAPSSGSTVMYALNPSASGALSLVFGLVGANGGVVVESTSSAAFSCFISSFSAPYIGVVGGDGFPLCAFPGGAPKTHITKPTPADPMAYLQSALIAGAPAPPATGGSCGSGSGRVWTGSPSQLAIGSSGWTLNPGVYCGGIVINPGATVTFAPGIYTLTSTSSSNGGLSVNAGSMVYMANTSNDGGAGFYNYGPYGGINFVCPSCTAGRVTFAAPNATNCATCASAWQGILFFQDPGNTSSSTIVGSSTYNVKVTGASYLPKASVNYALDFAVDYNLLVADTINLGVQWGGSTINTNFYNDFSKLSNGSPIKATNATITE